MATHQWKTISVRITEEEENALKILCAKSKRKKHALLKSLLLKELEPILKPGLLSIGEGLPLVGRHLFKYSSEKDNFTWQLNLGIHEVHALAENVPFSFVNALHKALTEAIKERQKIESRTSKKGVRIPKSILKYEVG